MTETKSENETIKKCPICGKEITEKQQVCSEECYTILLEQSDNEQWLF